MRDVERLPNVDFIYSVIVLQHNPPPIIAYVIRQFLRALNAGGVALFQVPTYRLGYEFVLNKYLSNEAKKSEMEMHVLTQDRIFEIIRQEGGKIIEVLEDGWTGLGYKELSNTFLVQKT
jgi:SAM-dependent methyltransferase